jgi:hypothetical protein
VLGQPNGERPTAPAADPSWGTPVTLLVLAKANADASAPWPWPPSLLPAPAASAQQPATSPPASATIFPVQSPPLQGSMAAQHPQYFANGQQQAAGPPPVDVLQPLRPAGPAPAPPASWPGAGLLAPHAGSAAGVYGDAPAASGGLSDRFQLAHDATAAEADMSSGAGQAGRGAGNVETGSGAGNVETGSGSEGDEDDADLRQVIQTCNCCLSETSSHSQVSSARAPAAARRCACRRHPRSVRRRCSEGNTLVEAGLASWLVGTCRALAGACNVSAHALVVSRCAARPSTRAPSRRQSSATRCCRRRCTGAVMERKVLGAGGEMI